MIFFKRAHADEPREPVNFWVSYSDLMAGMLLVFVLLLIVAMSHYAELTHKKQRLLRAQEVKLLTFRQLQQELIERLSGEFDDEIVHIDPATGVLQIETGILFGEGEATLRPDGLQRLNRIFDAYIRVILDDRFRDFIKQIEIEGHTNSRGTYLANLELSQQRALTVMKELLTRAGPHRDQLQRMVLAGGRSYSHLVLNDQGEEDLVRSRRIELKFRLKESEMFLDIYESINRPAD